MTGPCLSTRIISALLEPDGTIRLSLLLPGSSTPETVTIDPVETTIRSAGPEARAVQLEPGHEQDRHLRLIIAMHADALAYERERRAKRDGWPRLAG
jgi:hypothetical protein